MGLAGQIDSSGLLLELMNQFRSVNVVAPFDLAEKVFILADSNQVDLRIIIPPAPEFYQLEGKPPSLVHGLQRLAGHLLENRPHELIHVRPNDLVHDPVLAALFNRLQGLFLYVGGLAIIGQMFFLQEYTWDVKLHQAAAYIAMGIALPFFFAFLSQASRARWAATSTAAVYTVFVIGEILIFPLFPAQPKLGPVYNPVTHLIPAKFPVLILVPALVLDLLWRRLKNCKPWQIALVSGVLFIAVLTAVEWPFAQFLLSDASKNRFFGTIYFDYNSRPTGFDRMRQWFYPDHGAALYMSLLRAAVYATLSTWMGLKFGRWMRGVQR